MDNFREWLSDNLRYFMLGGAILLIVVVLFFGIRAFMGSGKGDSSKDTADEQVTADNDQGNVPSSPANDGETDGKKDANPMEKGNAEITALITGYYKALGDKDIATLKTYVDNLAPSDESKITNAKDYIEGYEVRDVYVKKGLKDDSYVVYASFYYICKDIDTKVTGRSTGHPVRALRNEMTKQYLDLEKKGATLEELEYLTLGGLRKAVVEGDVKNGSVMSGQIAGMIKEELTCREVIENIVAEAAKLLEKGACYE